MMQNVLSYENQLQSAKAFILEQDNFLVVSHVQPDGDAASSTMAVGWLLDSLGKQYYLINEGKLPDKFSFLYGSERLIDFSSAPPQRKFSHVITVDCADRSRVGKVAELFAEDVKILNIDHHPTNDYFGDYHLIDPDTAATAQILYDLAESLEVDWDKNLAECLYTGLLTDTGGFRYSNTSPKVMDIASKLLRYGVQNYVLAENLLERISLPHVRLLQRGLNTLRFDADERIGSIILTVRDIQETQAGHDDLEGIVHYPIRIDGVEVGLLFKEIDSQTVKVSLRSAGKVDVAQIAKELGGGGHVRAAGVTILKPLDETVELVVARIKQALA